MSTDTRSTTGLRRVPARRLRDWNYVISPRGKAATLMDDWPRFGQGPLWVGDTCWFGVLEATTRGEALRQLEERRQYYQREMA